MMQLSSASQSAGEQAVYDPQYSQIWVMLNSTPQTVSFEAPAGQPADCQQNCQCLQMTRNMSSNILLCCFGVSLHGEVQIFLPQQCACLSMIMYALRMYMRCCSLLSAKCLGRLLETLGMTILMSHDQNLC